MKAIYPLALALVVFSPEARPTRPHDGPHGQRTESPIDRLAGFLIERGLSLPKAEIQEEGRKL